MTSKAKYQQHSLLDSQSQGPRTDRSKGKQKSPRRLEALKDHSLLSDQIQVKGLTQNLPSQATLPSGRTQAQNQAQNQQLFKFQQQYQEQTMYMQHKASPVAKQAKGAAKLSQQSIKQSPR